MFPYPAGCDVDLELLERSAQAFSRSLTIAGYFLPQASQNSKNRSSATSCVGAA